MDITINPNFDINAIVLGHGSHPPGDQMCFMEAASVAAGEEWSDHPDCVSKVIGAFGRGINDAMDEGSRQALKPYVLKVLGSNVGWRAEVKRAKMVADWAQQFENADANAAAAYAANAATATDANAAAYAYAANATTDADAAAYAAAAAAAYAAYASARRQFWADLTPSILALLDAMIAVTGEE